MNFAEKDSSDVQFQMAPMVDILFLLLCFFVSSQMFAKWETEQGVQIPTSTEGDLPERLPGEIIINVHQDGRIVVQQRELDERSLGAVLKRVVSLVDGKPVPVVIRADERADFKYVIRIMDQCKKVNIRDISFATLKGK